MFCILSTGHATSYKMHRHTSHVYSNHVLAIQYAKIQVCFLARGRQVYVIPPPAAPQHNVCVDLQGKLQGRSRGSSLLWTLTPHRIWQCELFCRPPALSQPCAHKGQHRVVQCSTSCTTRQEAVVLQVVFLSCGPGGCESTAPPKLSSQPWLQTGPQPCRMCFESQHGRERRLLPFAAHGNVSNLFSHHFCNNQ